MIIPALSSKAPFSARLASPNSVPTKVDLEAGIFPRKLVGSVDLRQRPQNPDGWPLPPVQECLARDTLGQGATQEAVAARNCDLARTRDMGGLATHLKARG